MSTDSKYSNLASQALYDAAIKCLQAGKNIEARGALDRLYQQESIDPEGHLLYGVTYIQEGQYERVLDQLKLASDGGLQDDISLLFLCGCASYGLGRIGLATSLLERVVQQDAFHGPALANLGHIYLETGRIREAHAHYVRALEVYGEDGEGSPTIFAGISHVWHQRGETDLAIEAMERALKLESNAVNHSYLAGLFLEKGRYAEALGQDTMALALNPSDITARGNYAVALERAGQDPNLVLQAVESALEIGSDNALTHVQVAIVLDNIGMPERAGDTYQKALELSGEDTDPIKSYLCKNWDSAIRQERPYHFIAERLAGLGVPVAVAHAPLLS